MFKEGCVQGALKATRQVLCAFPLSAGQLAHATARRSPTTEISTFLEEAMSCESVVLLFAAIIANAGETKQLLIIEFKCKKSFLYQPVARPALVFFRCASIS